MAGALACGASGGSAKMTPSPPMPKLRSQILAACSGVMMGRSSWRLSICSFGCREDEREVRAEKERGKKGAPSAQS